MAAGCLWDWVWWGLRWPGEGNGRHRSWAGSGTIHRAGVRPRHGSNYRLGNPTQRFAGASGTDHGHLNRAGHAASDVARAVRARYPECVVSPMTIWANSAGSQRGQAPSVDQLWLARPSGSLSSAHLPYCQARGQTITLTLLFLHNGQRSHTTTR